MLRAFCILYGIEGHSPFRHSFCQCPSYAINANIIVYRIREYNSRMLVPNEPLSGRSSLAPDLPQ